ncbi:uncharacterized protein AMSG_00992 [Thecamonas trahens ATCC 50062]|uniref:Uncharacterized protein n=1 Tax=Thecamonas trahens ATCC 50062 TaxID=461836 RepID=A0A0L0DJC3_THETB|nr:hypothetical protein AMSG_00992 [Thecamonas trahens ATCC 50062]KNC52166.1 hypothetical protein AMSG_00992 [Thecamonas trahens ATCC 50062]|eukprot:XP_013762169.1 hypothetical protein AMSG_00992 [Thecamonas trahens ATCC 50062]
MAGYGTAGMGVLYDPLCAAVARGPRARSPRPTHAPDSPPVTVAGPFKHMLPDAGPAGSRSAGGSKSAAAVRDSTSSSRSQVSGKGKVRLASKKKPKPDKGKSPLSHRGSEKSRRDATRPRWSFNVARALVACTTPQLEPVRAHALLAEAVPLLSVPMFVYSSAEAARNGRKSLLALWEWLLTPAGEAVATKSAARSESIGENTRFTALASLMHRGEWSLKTLQFSKTLRPMASKIDIALAVRYRDALVATLRVALDALAGTFGTRLSSAKATFCARVLAVAYFSVPGVCGHIVLATDPPLTDAGSPETGACNANDASDSERSPSTPRWAGGAGDDEVVEDAGEDHDKARSRIERETKAREATHAELADLCVSDKMLSAQLGIELPPDLVVYPYLFRGLPQSASSEFEVDPDARWLSVLAKRCKMFMLFIRELVLHVRRVFRLSSGGAQSVVPWMLVPGFQALVEALCFEVRVRNAASGHDSAFIEATQFVLLNPYLISVLVRDLLSNISLHDVEQVGAGLDRVARWLAFAGRVHSRATLYNTFDPSFLIQVLDLLLGVERYSLTAKALAFISDHETVFQGEARIALMGNILLRKYFFHLFLHWSTAVRKLFHAVVIYHVVPIDAADAVAASVHISDNAPHWEVYLSCETNVEGPEQAVDLVLASKLHGYLTMLRDAAVPPHLAVYLPKALGEFDEAFMAYLDWRSMSRKVAPDEPGRAPPAISFDLTVHLPRDGYHAALGAAAQDG